MNKFRRILSRNRNDKVKYRPISSPYDPNGSYTGTSRFDDIPTQDADDL
ncbi:MAG: hypothetical protein ACI4MY_00525 [Christensenellales bacterium]